MKLVHRHNRCVGITLFKWGRKKLEVWFCPKDEEIEDHVHRHIDSVIVLLFGYMRGKIDFTAGHVQPWRRYPVPHCTTHSALTLSFCVFANWETWTGDVDVTSASVDFTAV